VASSGAAARYLRAVHIPDRRARRRLRARFIRPHLRRGAPERPRQPVNVGIAATACAAGSTESEKTVVLVLVVLVVLVVVGVGSPVAT